MKTLMIREIELTLQNIEIRLKNIDPYESDAANDTWHKLLDDERNLKITKETLFKIHLKEIKLDRVIKRTNSDELDMDMLKDDNIKPKQDFPFCWKVGNKIVTACDLRRAADQAQIRENLFNHEMNISKIKKG